MTRLPRGGLRVPRTLTARLVVTAVALVAVVAVLIGAATALAMRAYLTGQLDDKITSSQRRVDGPFDPDGDGDRGNRGARTQPPTALTPCGELGNQEPGTLVACPDLGRGVVLNDQRGDEQDLSSEEVEALGDIPRDGRVRTVDIDDHGSYRVVAVDTPAGTLVTGLPTRDVDEAVASVVRIELLLALLGVVAAGVAGNLVVRRQLRPLREVAETAHAVSALPLASGAIGVTERVPVHLTDEGTEVGQVGSALNTLLAHVESSLDARHRSEQQVRQFVADASHELRTPLATIVGYTELARRRPDDPGTASTALAKVEEESSRMTALVEDLLLLARLDAGRPLVGEPVDLTRLLLEAVSDARVVAPDHRWRLELPETSVEVVGDERRLHQVVTNLLTNARKHTPPGTTVTVSAYPTGGGPGAPGGGRLTVHDDGPGFPPDLVGDDGRGAFERFARGDAARHREGGAGLGLALVEAIVSAHGGSVGLRSRPGASTIEVTLPAE